MDVEVEYYYDDEGLMVLHDIKRVTMFDEEAKKGEVKGEKNVGGLPDERK